MGTLGTSLTRELASQVLDILRCGALLTGILSETEGMSPLEYIDLSVLVMEEGERLTAFLVQLLEWQEEHDVEAPDWYRVVRSAELAVPRVYLGLLVGKAYLTRKVGKEMAAAASPVNSSETAVDGQWDTLLDMRSACGSLGNSLKGLAAHFHLLSTAHRLFVTSDEQRGPEGGGKDEEKGETKGDKGKVQVMPRLSGIDQMVQFLVEDFGLINRLWVRMYLADSGDADVISRRQIESIVVLPIRLLAQVLAVHGQAAAIQLYSHNVLPIILQHLMACRDEMAQEVVTEALLGEFPQEYHQQTIEQLLDAISRFQVTIDIRRLVSAVINKVLPGTTNEVAREEAQVSATDRDTTESGVPDGQLGDQTSRAGEAFDSIWSRISGLLLLRLEASRAEEAILLCSPLLNHALAIKPFQAARVESILEFIYMCAERRRDREIAVPFPEAQGGDESHSEPMGPPPSGEGEVSPGRTVHLAKIVDLVVEFIPEAGQLFHLPSLFLILEESSSMRGGGPGEASAASCALLLIDRLVRDGYRLEKTDKDDDNYGEEGVSRSLGHILRVTELILRHYNPLRMIQERQQQQQPQGAGPSTDDSDIYGEEEETLVRCLGILDNVSASLCHQLGIGAVHSGEIMESACRTDNVWGVLIMVIHLTRALLATPDASIAQIQGHLEETLQYLTRHRPAFILPRSRLVGTAMGGGRGGGGGSNNGEFCLGLDLFLPDGLFLGLISGCWLRCARHWHQQRVQRETNVEGRTSTLLPSSSPPSPSLQTSPNPSVSLDDAVYDALVAILLIYEDEITETLTQVEVLQLLIDTLFSPRGPVLIRRGADLSLLVGKLFGNVRKLLKTTDRLPLSLLLLERATSSGVPVEADVRLALSRSVQGLLGVTATKEAISIRDVEQLELHMRFARCLLDQLAWEAAEPTPGTAELLQFTRLQMTLIENYIGDHHGIAFKVREGLEELRSDWSRWGVTTRVASTNERDNDDGNGDRPGRSLPEAPIIALGDRTASLALEDGPEGAPVAATTNTAFLSFLPETSEF